jgi:hypothetical protein
MNMVKARRLKTHYPSAGELFLLFPLLLKQYQTLLQQPHRRRLDLVRVSLQHRLLLLLRLHLCLRRLYRLESS